MRREFLAILLLGSPALADPPADVTYHYDDAGRLTAVEYSDGKEVQYVYDAAGNRTAASEGILPELSIASPLSNPTEGGNLVYRVTLTGTTAQTIAVDCVPVDGTAESTGPGAPYDDFVTTKQVLSFGPADPSGTVKNCTIATKADTYFEGAETVNGTLQNASPGALLKTVGAVGTILDDDAAPTLGLAGNVSATEGGTLLFTVNKSGLSEFSHSVSYASSDGTATTADADYAAATGSLTFSAATVSLPTSIATTGDSKYESAETLNLTLSNPTGGATLGTASAVGTINNDDVAPTFAINDPASVTEGGLITFTVTKAGSTQLTHAVSWATANNSAVAPGDYASANGSLSFTSAETSKTLQVQSNTDAVSGEGTETFHVNLSGQTNGATLADSQGIGSIDDPGSSIPGVPGNLRTSPSGVSFGGSYSVLWDAATGPVSYYVLEESVNDAAFTPPDASFTINAPTTSKSFNHSSGVGNDYYYQVKACNVSNQCSAYSAIVIITVCETWGCP